MALGTCGCLDGILAQLINGSKKSVNITDLVKKENEQGKGVVRRNSFGIGDMIVAKDATRCLKDDYDVTSSVPLGQGGFATVYSVKHTPSTTYRAVKRIAKEEMTIDAAMLAVEISTLVSLDHPNVMKIFEWFEDEKSLNIVTELIPGKELSNYVEDRAVPILMRQLLQAVSYCHSQSVVHRDLKLENCLVLDAPQPLDMKLTVIDFGLAAVCKPGEAGLTLKAGTPIYMSPAIISGKEKYGTKCDIWAAGVIFHILTTGEHPFVEKDQLKHTELLFKTILNREIRKEPLARLKSEDEQKMVKLMLTKDAKVRPSAQELLRYPYFSSGRNLCQIRVNNLLTRMMLYTQKATKFDKAILLVIARHSKSEEIATLRHTFKKFDTSGDGQLHEDELAAAFNSQGFSLSREEVKRVFSALDTDECGAIGYTEWLAATLEPSVITSEEAARVVLNFFDSSKRGKISVADLGLGMSSEDAEEAIRRWDRDSDGALDYKELKAALDNISKRRRLAAKDFVAEQEASPTIEERRTPAKAGLSAWAASSNLSQASAFTDVDD